MSDDEHVPEFFGEPWPSGICETGVQVPTPVGSPCLFCDDTIVDGDRGSYIGTVRSDDAGKPVASREPAHRECLFREVMGGIGHQRGECMCHGGDGDPDGDMTRRESALAVWEHITQRKGQ